MGNRAALAGDLRAEYAAAADDAERKELLDAWKAERDARGDVLAEMAGATRPAAVSIEEIDEAPAEPLLSAFGEGGAVLPVGEVCVLSGPGGTGKSTLVGDIALAVSTPSLSASLGGPFRVHAPGPVLWLAYEERAGLIAARALARRGAVCEGGEVVREHDVSVLALRGGRWPLFGPADRPDGTTGLYNARPGTLAGWGLLEAECDRLAPRLVIVDPALSAFVGEPNAAPPVREFLERLADFVEARQAAALVLAHATKANDMTPFDRGQAGGSGAWTDAVRSCLTLVHGDGSGERGDGRTVGVLKANNGPSMMWAALKPVRLGRTAEGGMSRWITGFAGRKWRPADEWRKATRREPQSSDNGGEHYDGSAIEWE